MQVLIALVLIGVAIALWPVALAVGVVYLLYRIIRFARKKRYFSSEAFARHKQEIANVVSEHNDVVAYVSEIRAAGSFQIGSSSTGKHSHLSSFENISKHKYRRNRNEASYQAANVHNCSLQVVRNASADPIKYLMKYFDIKADEETLVDVEELGESISRLENAVQNVQDREGAIKESFSPPVFILKHYEAEFLEQVGLNLPQVEVPFPTYFFEYVSAGGNSGQRTTVQLDTPAIDALAEVMAEKIRFRKSAAGQRALMTAKLREFIKHRDGYACRYCSVSLSAEPHLLLEVDHIMPLSRGGLSTHDNLQTLCWRCNRKKSNSVA